MQLPSYMKHFFNAYYHNDMELKAFNRIMWNQCQQTSRNQVQYDIVHE